VVRPWIELPERLAGELAGSLVGESGDAVTGVGELVQAVVGPVVPEEPVGLGLDGGGAVIPGEVVGVGDGALQAVSPRGAVVGEHAPVAEAEGAGERGGVGGQLGAGGAGLVDRVAARGCLLEEPRAVRAGTGCRG
jgi:hypothetical protein